MADRNQLHSPIHRAMLGLSRWLEELPKEMRSDASSALDHMRRTAEQEIEQAYFAGYNSRSQSELIRKIKDDTPTVRPVAEV